jgi:hypothetical protein
MEREVLAGSAEEITELCRGYEDVGFRHFIYHAPAPNDDETLERFATEVRPNLD